MIYIVCKQITFYTPEPMTVWQEVFQAKSDLDCYIWINRCKDDITEYRIFGSID